MLFEIGIVGACATTGALVGYLIKRSEKKKEVPFVIQGTSTCRFDPTKTGRTKAEREELKAYYLKAEDLGLTTQEVADALKISVAAVDKYCAKNGIILQ